MPISTTLTGAIRVQRDSIHLDRFKFLHANTCYERFRLRRFNPLPGPIAFEIGFAADFADLFEVRGNSRPRRGSLTVERVDERRRCASPISASTRCGAPPSLTSIRRRRC